MNDDPYLSAGGNARKIGLLVAFLVVTALLLVAAWYMAKQLHGVKLNKAQQEAAALESARKQVREQAAAAQPETPPTPPAPVAAPAEPAATPAPVIATPAPVPVKAAAPVAPPPAPMPAPAPAPIVTPPRPRRQNPRRPSRLRRQCLPHCR